MDGTGNVDRIPRIVRKLRDIQPSVGRPLPDQRTVVPRDDAERAAKTIELHLLNGDFAGARRALQDAAASIEVAPLGFDTFLCEAVRHLPENLQPDARSLSSLEANGILTLRQLLQTPRKRLSIIAWIGAKRCDRIVEAARYLAQEIER